MLRVALMGFIVFFNFIIESTLFRYIEIRRIAPNSAVAITVCYAVLRGSAEGAIVGMLTGLMQDIFFGTSIGYYALIYMTIGYLCGIPTERFFKDNFIIPLAATIGCMILSGIFIYVTKFLIRRNFDFGFYFSNIILPETVYTAVCSFFIYRVFYGINRRLEEHEFNKRKVF